LTSSQNTEWDATLDRITAEGDGFHEALGPRHRAVFIRKGPTLVVSFDNLDDVRQSPDRMPWGVEFVTAQGWSSLGLMAHGSTWYRDDAVHDFFDRLRDQGFFRQFDRVVFYGTSMGGYAACAFSLAVPGAVVMAVNPQATLDRDIAGWERRFRPAWRQDFSGRYGYAPDCVAGARKLWLFYDPTIVADSMHAALFQGAHVEKIRCPLMGHGVLSVWRDMGVLKAISAGVIEGTATRMEILRHLRARHGSPRYQKLLLIHLLKAGRDAQVIRLCRWVLNRADRPHFRAALAQSLERMAKAGRRPPGSEKPKNAAQHDL
jgi:hypothetical protein